MSPAAWPTALTTMPPRSPGAGRRRSPPSHMPSAAEAAGARCRASAGGSGHGRGGQVEAVGAHHERHGEHDEEHAHGMDEGDPLHVGPGPARRAATISPKRRACRRKAPSGCRSGRPGANRAWPRPRQHDIELQAEMGRHPSLERAHEVGVKLLPSSTPRMASMASEARSGPRCRPGRGLRASSPASARAPGQGPVEPPEEDAPLVPIVSAEARRRRIWEAAGWAGSLSDQASCPASSQISAQCAFAHRHTESLDWRTSARSARRASALIAFSGTFHGQGHERATSTRTHLRPDRRDRERPRG
jgi:hypothetical protein